MASLNKVLLIGNLGRDPKLRYMSNGEAVCNLSIATTDKWKDKNGQQQERTEWHNIVMYRQLAEIAYRYLEKGSQVYLEGRLQTRKWQDKASGQDRYTTEVIADQMKMLGGRNELPESVSPASPPAAMPEQQAVQAAKDYQSAKEGRKAPPKPQSFDDFEDDMPF